MPDRQPQMRDASFEVVGKVRVGARQLTLQS